MNKKGQALVEYILIIALISVIAIALVNYFGGYLKDAITKASCGMLGQTYVEGKNPGEGVCE
ncbi:MAG: Flp family type IVb pilin [Bacilli bacterium]|nr:Flp family type IVb pilin [Bacilli bacterium]